MRPSRYEAPKAFPRLCHERPSAVSGITIRAEPPVGYAKTDGSESRPSFESAICASAERRGAIVSGHREKSQFSMRWRRISRMRARVRPGAGLRSARAPRYARAYWTPACSCACLSCSLAQPRSSGSVSMHTSSGRSPSRNGAALNRGSPRQSARGYAGTTDGPATGPRLLRGNRSGMIQGAGGHRCYRRKRTEDLGVQQTTQR
jgi:hypothetical protein